MAQSTLSRPGEAQASGALTEGTSVEKPKKRRILGDRAALGVTQEEAYYQAPSLGGGTGVSAFLTTSRHQPPSGLPGGKTEGQGREFRVVVGVRGLEGDKEP